MLQSPLQEKLSRLYLFYGTSKTLAVLHGGSNKNKNNTNIHCLINYTNKLCFICQKCVHTFFPSEGNSSIQGSQFG